MDSEIVKEKEYLLSKLDNDVYNNDRFVIICGDDRYVFGIVSPKGEETTFSKPIQYKTLFDTIKDLDYKIKFSFKTAIDFSYSDKAQKKFSLLHQGTTEEIFAYYYIENAIFRTISLWDMLAQLYRLYYNVKVDKRRVDYKAMFNPKYDYCIKFRNKAKEISRYLYQKDDTNIEGPWQGNHKFINEFRNKMTHRNAPTVATMSDYDINLKAHPVYILKRAIEDYEVVTKFISEIIEKADADFNDVFK